MANHAKEAYTSPKGNLKWAFVDGQGKETERGSGKYKYSVVVKLLATDPECIKAMAHIDQFWTDNKPKNAKVKPKTKAYKMEEDEHTGEETGYVYFSFSTSTSFPSGDKKVVKLFTAKTPVREVSLGGKKIGEASLGRAIGTLAIYEFNGSFGTTCFLDAISLSKFVEYVGGVDAESIEADDDAEDIGLGEAVVGTDSVAEEAPEEQSTDVPRT